MDSFCVAHSPLINISIFVLRRGQETTYLARCLVFPIPKCPMCNCCSISCCWSGGITIQLPLMTKADDSFGLIPLLTSTEIKYPLRFSAVEIPCDIIFPALSSSGPT